MDKAKIIQALKHHNVPVTDSNEGDDDDDNTRGIESLDNAFNYRPTMETPHIDLSFNMSSGNQGSRDDITFEIDNRIGDKTITTVIARGDDISWTSYEELADKLLEIEEFAKKIRVLTTDDLGRWESMVDDNVKQLKEAGYIEKNYGLWLTLDQLSQEIMSVKI